MEESARPIRLSVKLHATLRRYLPAGVEAEPFSVELFEGARVSDLLARLGIPDDHAKICIVDGEQSPKERVLRDGASVALFPPLAGG